jgi:hypothetical protein
MRDIVLEELRADCMREVDADNVRMSDARYMMIDRRWKRLYNGREKTASSGPMSTMFLHVDAVLVASRGWIVHHDRIASETGQEASLASATALAIGA